MSQAEETSANRPAFGRSRVKDVLTVVFGVFWLLIGIGAVAYAGYNLWRAWGFVTMMNDD